MNPDPACQWAYSYLRFSTSPQEEGDTLRRQGAALEAWLARNPNVRLDKSLKAWDRRALSGFSADHRTNPRFVLAQFESLVSGGRVAPGSYLVVENLDRLTREHWTEALPYVLSLIQKGIRIVQLSPTEVIYDANMDQGRLFLMLLELGRAHGESKLKSERVNEAWEAKRAAARDGAPHGGRIPAWIELAGGEYRLKPVAAAAVKVIFRMAAQGLGGTAIVKALRANSVAAIHGTNWRRSYVSKILNSRTALGEWQPLKHASKGRAKACEPIPNYYPAVVTEAEFYAARKARRARAGKTGRPSAGPDFFHPFSGLLRSALDGGKLYRAKSRGRPTLISEHTFEAREGATFVSFPADHFTDGLLSQLQEVSAASLFIDQGVGELETLRAQLAAARDRLTAASARWRADPLSLAWQGELSAADKESRAIAAQLRDAEQLAATPASATWAEAVSLMRANDPPRLRQCLLETVDVVWALFVRAGRDTRLAAVQVDFQGGRQRHYLLLSETPAGHSAKRRPRRWVAFSLAEKLPGGFNLADKRHVAKLARLLQKLDVSSL